MIRSATYLAGEVLQVEAENRILRRLIPQRMEARSGVLLYGISVDDNHFAPSSRPIMRNGPMARPVIGELVYIRYIRSDLTASRSSP